MKPLRHAFVAFFLPLTLAGCSPEPSAVAATPTVSPRQIPGQPADPEVATRDAEARAEIACRTDRYLGSPSALTVQVVLADQLLMSGRYEPLEKFLTELETTPPAWSDQFTPLQQFYEEWGRVDKRSRAATEGALGRWRAASTSKYPTVVMAALRSYWLMEDGFHWRNLADRQELYWKNCRILQVMANPTPQVASDPEFWEARLRAGVVGHEKPEILDKALADTIERDPRRWTAYALRALAEHPVMGDEKGYESYLAIVDRLAQKGGPEVYAACAWTMLQRENWDFQDYRAIGLPWPKVKQGLEALRQANPGSAILLDKQACLAAASGQNEEARGLLEQVGRNWSSTVWRDFELHQKTCQLVGADWSRSGDLPSGVSAGPEAALFDDSPLARKMKLRYDGQALLREARYQALDRASEKLRVKDQRLLAQLYASCIDYGSTARTEATLGHCDSWERVAPGSPTARVVRAATLTHSAWDARGGGTADTVTEEGWKGFKTRLQEARRVLDAGDLPDVYACSTRTTIARGLSESRSVVDSALKRSYQLDPKGGGALEETLQYLLPKWHGQDDSALQACREVMKARGDEVVALSLVSLYDRDILEALPYELLDRSLKAASKRDARVTAPLRAYLELYHGHAEKAVKAITAAVASGELTGEEIHRLRSRSSGLADGLFDGAPVVETMDLGQYAATIPEPKKVASAESGLPIIPGRGLGIRLRHLRDVDQATTRTVTIERPRSQGETGEGKVTETQQTWLPPGTHQKGQEETVIWTLEEDRQAPGPWTMSVWSDDKLLAQETFQMEASDEPPEPGLRLEFRGLLTADTKTSRFPVPVRSTAQVPRNMGTSFGIVIHFVGKPKSGGYVWLLPPRRKGEKPQRFETKFDCSGVEKDIHPQLSQWWNFEREHPEELIPGIWTVSYQVDGKPVGSVKFEVQ